jgi:hypothetical protein
MGTLGVGLGAVLLISTCARCEAERKAEVARRASEKAQRVAERAEEDRKRLQSRPTHLYCWSRDSGREPDHDRLPKIDGEYCAGMRARFADLDLDRVVDILEAEWDHRPTTGGHGTGSGTLHLTTDDGHHFSGVWVQRAWKRGRPYEWKGRIMSLTCFEERCHGVSESDRLESTPVKYRRVSLERLP